MMDVYKCSFLLDGIDILTQLGLATRIVEQACMNSSVTVTLPDDYTIREF